MFIFRYLHHSKAKNNIRLVFEFPNMIFPADFDFENILKNISTTKMDKIFKSFYFSGNQKKEAFINRQKVEEVK